jgi:hypothetical protein
MVSDLSGSSFIAAMYASGDVLFSPHDSALGRTWEFGLVPPGHGGGKPASADGWRRVLDEGSVMAPSPAGAAVFAALASACLRLLSNCCGRRACHSWRVASSEGRGLRRVVLSGEQRLPKAASKLLRVRSTRARRSLEWPREILPSLYLQFRHVSAGANGNRISCTTAVPIKLWRYKSNFVVSQSQMTT